MKEVAMEPENPTDHIALLSLMITGTLIKRLDDVDLLDDHTARLLHQLVRSVHIHARSRGLNDLDILFDNIDRTLRRHLATPQPT
jgi:hypothetical protein